MNIDNRLILILFIIVSLVYGQYILSWNIPIEKMAMIFSVGVFTYFLFSLAFKIPAIAILNILITSFILIVLSHTDYIFIYGMASFFAISSKYIFQYKRKHIFNPANFGLVFMVLFTGKLSITSLPINFIFFSVLLTGIIWTLYRSNYKKLDSIGFIYLFYLWIFGLWEVLYGQCNLHAVISKIWETPFAIFSLLVIADPVSTPDSRFSRMIWVFFIVIVSLVFEKYFGISYGYYYALFLMNFIVPILDAQIRGDYRFSWDSFYRRELNS